MTTREGKKRQRSQAKGQKSAKGKARSPSADAWVAPFPRPANINQRYDGDHPWLAIVNARGPKGVWKHEKINPSWLPLCDDLRTHPAWRTWSLECQFLTQIIWQYAAKHDINGIVWGEPEMLRRQIRCIDGARTAATIVAICDDRAKFMACLEAYAAAGFICYLADTEKEAAERLIFAKQHRQDRDRDRDRTEESTVPGSGVVSSESANPGCTQTTGQDTESTAKAQATGTGAGQQQDQSRQPANPQKPEAGQGQQHSQDQQKLEVGGTASGKALAGPRIDASPYPIGGSSQGAIVATPVKRRRCAAQAGEPSLLGDIAMLRYNDPLNLAFGCEMHNATHKGACLYPGTREQRDAWGSEVWSDVFDPDPFRMRPDRPETFDVRRLVDQHEVVQDVVRHVAEPLPDESRHGRLAAKPGEWGLEIRRGGCLLITCHVSLVLQTGQRYPYPLRAVWYRSVQLPAELLRNASTPRSIRTRSRGAPFPLQRRMSFRCHKKDQGRRHGVGRSSPAVSSIPWVCQFDDVYPSGRPARAGTRAKDRRACRVSRRLWCPIRRTRTDAGNNPCAEGVTPNPYPMGRCHAIRNRRTQWRSWRPPTVASPRT